MLIGSDVTLSLNHVWLKVMPVKGVRRFEILERVGSLAYWLALPPQLVNVHNVFHVSMLRKYMPDPQHIIDYQTLGVKESFQ